MVGAATFVVDTTTDDPALIACDGTTPNDCSLRGATLEANARPPSEANTIIVPAGVYVLSQSSACTYTTSSNPNAALSSSQIPLCLSAQTTIQGAGAATTVIDGNHQVRVLFISAAAIVNLRGVTIRNGLADRSFFENPNGGGINNHGTLTLTETVVRENQMAANTGGGAGIFNQPGASLTLVRSVVTGNGPAVNNAGDGGGIHNSVGVVTLIDSTISHNTAANGGGIYSTNGIATISGSTLSDNTATASGGGLFNSGGNLPGTVTMVNSTVSGNTSESAGGGILTGGPGGTTDLSNVTVAGNVCTRPLANGGCTGGGVAGSGISLQNTLIADNDSTNGVAAHDCNATLVSRGYNLIENTNACVITGASTGNRTGVDPKLGPLADNGGLTWTHSLASDSPAIDAGNPAHPGSGGPACPAIDQRGALRTFGATCDLGAFELGGVFSLAKTLPNTGGNTGSLAVVVSGQGFAPGATVRLTRPGQADIIGSPAQVDVTGVAVATTFDLTGRAIGLWDVIVTNPNGATKTQTEGFAVEAGRDPQLWTDVLGATVVRAGRLNRYLVFFGNRGNVDALAVPLVLQIRPAAVAVSLGFLIAPPPPQAGYVPTDFTQEPITAVPNAGRDPDSTIIPLLLPVVPAGFSGVLEVRLTLPAEVANFEIVAGLDAPLLHPTADPQIVDDFTAGARAYASQALGTEVPVALVPELAQYFTSQLANVVGQGRTALVENVGTRGLVYSQAHLLIDLATFAAARANANASFPTMLRLLASVLGVRRSEAAGGGPVGCDSMGNCHSECDVGFGSLACANLNGGAVGSGDPNHKYGSIGAGAAQHVAPVGPLRYAVLFENMPIATAPAQEVVVTDQLDPNLVDLETFSLGPISFGDTTVVPPPGLHHYSTSVDLRPARDLIVVIDARLDMPTALVTWRLTAIDPLTGQATEDPLAGFLPPNVSPPEGDGGVLFTIQPKVAGTPICNQARIVFDLNAPIDTPQWCNTIDDTAPSSAVQPLPASQATPDFLVEWTGADQGAGVADYALFVSVNGGPFAVADPHVTTTSTIFHGEAGKDYAFYTIARDLVGNAELPPATFDARTVVLGSSGADDLALTKIGTPRAITLRAGRPPKNQRLMVRIQNRSPRATTVADADTLRPLVVLTIDSLGTCAPPVPTLRVPKKFPIVVKPKKSLTVAFDVTFACANHPDRSTKNDPAQDDYRVSGAVVASALGLSDVHPADDTCPRQVTPPGVIDVHPDGTIRDKGCGARKPDKTFGGPLLVDVVVR